MFKGILTFFLSCIFLQSFAENIRGQVLDAESRMPVEGVTVTIMQKNVSAITDINGRFVFNTGNTAHLQIRVYAIGYTAETFFNDQQQEQITLYIKPIRIQLQDVLVVANTGNHNKAITTADIAMRGVSNSQEVLQIIPGVFIGQHQGGGKAEQIFVRGFDADHGTDLRLEVDGVPVNMVSHAHGQGYADSHFVIPETIQSVDYKKGPYDASKGDFATTGSVNYQTKNYLANNTIKLEAGMFNTYRLLGMFNLLPKTSVQKQQSWYAASEYRYSDGYFDNSQHFSRYNFFTRYNGKLSENSHLSVSASTFYSKWDASGQIPVRAVEQNLIGFYGAIDPNEGGKTSRTLINAILSSSLANGAVINNQIFYSHSNFDLFSNFTLFLNDSINGDQIRQKETRNMFGYNGSYQKSGFSDNTKFTTAIGFNTRADVVKGSELSHTKNRFTLLLPIKFGDITQVSVSPYINETVAFGDRFTLTGGLRFDQFWFAYNNMFAGDSSAQGLGKTTAKAAVLNPSINLTWQANKRSQFYISAGKGFHSNDTRVAVATGGEEILPRAFGVDIGAVNKPGKNIIVNVAAWYLYLQQEFVYSGDGGFVEFSGKTRRFGLDFSGRYQPFKFLYIDADVNYAHARTAGEEKGNNFVPLAPVLTGSGGVTFTGLRGLQVNLRNRYMSHRAANETNSIIAQGYHIFDATVKMTRNKFEVGLFINNLLNSKWKETQFNTETRLKNEPSQVEEICFTPGTPFSARLVISIFIK